LRLLLLPRVYFERRDYRGQFVVLHGYSEDSDGGYMPIA
jgi:hypothetical protein